MNPRAKKITRNIIFLLSIPLIIVAFVFANITSKEQVCKGLQISVTNPQISFVTKEDVINIIEDAGIKSNQTLVHQIDVKSIERIIETNKWISNADVFVAANSFLNVSVSQKNPVLRVQQNDSSDYGYYLDEYANPIEISEQYTPRIMVATTKRLGYSKHDLNLKSSLVRISNFIQKDTFWNTFISQIDMDSKGVISLIPMFGKQTILFGNEDSMENKFARLFEFYKQGMNTIDWNLYDELDVRFVGQVVARNFSGQILSDDPYGAKEQHEMNIESKDKLKATQKSPSKTVIAKKSIVMPKETLKVATKIMKPINVVKPKEIANSSNKNGTQFPIKPKAKVAKEQTNKKATIQGAKPKVATKKETKEKSN